jgi:hypothetical protein
MTENPMKTSLLLSALVLATTSLLAADSEPKAAVVAAAKKLAAQSNYSWSTTVVVPEGARFRPGPTEGKTEKDGFTFLSMTRRDTTTEAVIKGGKGAIKTDEGWKSLADAAKDDGGGFNMTRFAALMLQEYLLPAAQAEDIVAKMKEVKLSDGVYAGDLTDEGAKQLLQFRRGGSEGPEISGAKGSVKFWVKDGILSKYEFKLQGKMSFNGNDSDVDRTTTVEVKDIGTTKVTVPEEASKKAS